METVRIAGGGLAGLSLAAGLRLRGVPVEVREAGSYPRHRVCGEFISGVSLGTLEALGIDESLADAVRSRTMSWWREGRRVLVGELPEAALGISRFELDARLKLRVEALGGRVIEHDRCRPEGAEGAEGEVWAAGRGRGSDTDTGAGRWIGLKCHVKGLEREADLEMHLGRNGYVGLAPVENGRVNVCGLFRLDKECRGRGSGRLLSYLRAGGHDVLADRIGAAWIDESSFTGVAGFGFGWQGWADGVCRLGDAAAMIPPFTGNGMSMAFESAELALEPLEAWSRGRLGWTECVTNLHDATRRRFRRRVGAAMAMQRVLMSGRGRDLIEAVSRAGLLPLSPLLSLVR